MKKLNQLVKCNYDIEILGIATDYRNVKEVLKIERRKSIDFLKNALNNLEGRGFNSGKIRENKECNKKYNIWCDFKGISDYCTFFNAHRYDLSYGRPVSWIEFAFYVYSSGAEFSRTWCWFCYDI